MSRDDMTLILGAGVTGIAASLASGCPAYEASSTPGGICSSYHLSPGSNRRRPVRAPDEEDFRFEKGGGHWIFGGHPAVIECLSRISPMKQYSRRSSIHIPARSLTVPYPIQYHLSELPEDLADKAFTEMMGHGIGQPTTLHQWLRHSFGVTLCDLFFDPFHELYTAGLWKDIAPQDAFKSPVDRDAVRLGKSRIAPPAGYNVQFHYPANGLGYAIQQLAWEANVFYNKRVEAIDPAARMVSFADGSSMQYGRILSTLPLNRMLSITGLTTASEPDPHTSVLVANIAARRGQECPEDHWMYVPSSNAGFHRIGWYSNVDPSFLPRSMRDGSIVSLYVETAFRGDNKPDQAQISVLCDSIIADLREWRIIDDVLLVDPTWIDVAYTWQLPGSTWKAEAIEILRGYGIHQIGRYGRWQFQGIADSIQEGFLAGAEVASISYKPLTKTYSILSRLLDDA